MKMIVFGICLKECFQCLHKVIVFTQFSFENSLNYHSLTGIPELGIDHFEPLIIPSIQVSRGSGSLTLTGGFKNLIVKGPSNTTVDRAR